MTKDEIRDRLVELLSQKGFGVEGAKVAADHLIANGVTFADDELKTLVNEYKQRVERSLSVLRGVQEESKWVPVSERLPDDSTTVNLCTRSRIVGTGFYDKYTKKWVQYYSGGAIYVGVTHWMPMPQAPKEVE